MEKDGIRRIVRDGYARRAAQGGACDPCGGRSISEIVGYSAEELGSVPGGADMGLGCGNPVAIASVKEGETVIDLGCGGGLDCFLAANKTGKTGRVIGIDMTPEMIEKARENATKGNYTNVEFRLGEIENLPVADNSGDLVISNCVINLSPDKPRVFREVFRILKPGGRIMISDLVLTRDLPEFLKDSVDAYISCLAGAVKKDEYTGVIRRAGFREVEIIDERAFTLDCHTDDPIAKALIENTGISPRQLEEVAGAIASIKVRGVKAA